MKKEKMIVIGGLALAFALIGFFASASAFFWESRSSQEIFDEATVQIEAEIEVATERLQELRILQLKAQKDLAIDKLKTAADKADTSEIDRLNAVLVELDRSIKGTTVEINFPVLDQ